MNTYIKLILFLFLILLLFLVRAFSAELFYDPLIEYFRNDYLYTKMPEVDLWHLVIDMLFRYVINSTLTILIIWVLFYRKDYVKFTCFFLMTAFIFLIILFVILIRDQFESGYLLPFYIRRFIIHPLFLLILLPAFYFQKLSNK
ncbi:MAG: exosortase F-associated protein [Polaribacter sp.]|jgi:exosortase F-associated protein